MSTGPGVVVTATRRRSDGGPSARALLISVLGQWVGADDTPVWNTTLVGALEALGIESRAARQAISRTAADGWLEGESVGRYTRWRLSVTGRRLLATAGARLQRSFVAGAAWDGRFLLLVLTGTGPDRPTRDRLATRLDFEGFGSLGPNLWVAADQRALTGAQSLLDALGLSDDALLFAATTVEGSDSPAEVVARAWDLQTAARAHVAFLEAFEGVDPVDDREAFALRTRLAHEWRHLLSVDPALPAELLPPAWPGLAAAELFHRCHTGWAEPAARFFETLRDDVVVPEG